MKSAIDSSMSAEKITISTNIQELTGEGLEYLVSPHNTHLVVARFFNGQIMGSLPAGNDDDTQEAA